MLYTIKNDKLTVSVSDRGAELMSVVGNGCEYIWVGNEEFWPNRAPLVFPICGRLLDGKYTYRGKTYEMNLHGFIRPSHLEVTEHNESSICLTLKESEETKKIYPFDFTLNVWYILEGDKLINRLEIHNPGDDVLPATIGGHPGFNVPLDGAGAFEDYYLEFENECSPDKFIFSERCLLAGKKAFPLEGGKVLKLRHDLFDNDAIFLSRADSTVTLKSDKSDRFVKVDFSDMPYVGIWHKPKTKAPYVCIEPWCGLPANDGEIADMETRPDMFHIQPGSTKRVEFSMIFG